MPGQQRANHQSNKPQRGTLLVLASAILATLVAIIGLIVEHGFSLLFNVLAGINMLATARATTVTRELSTPAKEEDDSIQQILSDVELTLERIFGCHPPLDIPMKYAPSSVTGLAAYDSGSRPTRELLFAEFSKSLLILGARGSGKSVILLQLAQHHLQTLSAIDRQVPVLLDLSTWSVKRQSFEQWLVDQSPKAYRLPRRTFQQWLKKEKLLLLLDGLDEVPIKNRTDCVQAINRFHRQHPLIGLVACCDLGIYQDLGTKLSLRDAVILEPLDQSQIDSQIDEPSLLGLSRFLQLGGPLRALAETPFLLNAMKLAFSNVSFASLKRCVPINTDCAWLKTIIQSYAELHIGQLAEHTAYSTLQVRNNLIWLAEWITRHRQNVAYLEEAIQPDNLRTEPQRLLFRFMSAGYREFISHS